MEYGCIGEKLSHSFSKEIHADLASYEYEIREIPRDELAAFMHARAFRAINVTIPYKQDVIPYLDEIDPIAARIGAVNTIVHRDGKLVGYNTDFFGMTALLERGGITLADKKVLVLGSGGTSKTAEAVASALGARAVCRVSRTARDGCITYEQARTQHADAQIILNATPCGMFPNPDAQPVDLTDFPEVDGVADAIYNPLRSRLVLQAQARGVAAIGGLYMLVAQAAAAVEHFLGTAVDKDEIERVYRKIRNDKQNLVLIGMPGCGTTTLGKRVAARLGMDFIDTDEQIVKRTGKQIPDIFAEQGERGFREIEAAVVRSLESVQHTVIATGGGAILRPDNLTALRANGKLCFLDRPLDALVTTDDRPLSSNAQLLCQRYEERYELYCAAADFTVNCVSDMDENIRNMEEGFLQ
ncbi:MAG: shikimate dehydrogenase [Clostridia bacterium]|nr:shikimate dehydrogenase [Clostridia bacterium]